MRIYRTTSLFCPMTGRKASPWSSRFYILNFMCSLQYFFILFIYSYIFFITFFWSVINITLLSGFCQTWIFFRHLYFYLKWFAVDLCVIFSVLAPLFLPHYKSDVTNPGRFTRRHKESWDWLWGSSYTGVSRRQGPPYSASEDFANIPWSLGTSW